MICLQNHPKVDQKKLRHDQARIQRGAQGERAPPPLEKMGSHNLPRTDEFFRGGRGYMVSVTVRFWNV